MEMVAVDNVLQIERIERQAVFELFGEVCFEEAIGSSEGLAQQKRAAMRAKKPQRLIDTAGQKKRSIRLVPLVIETCEQCWLLLLLCSLAGNGCFWVISLR